ncbi:unnamed protein product [Rotaria sp. Silwood2]|nr:unnamed protein product [Rotaria sp. Silwood2]CAF4019493.1 unnamed protein product [Rotaria sp. Silwood2]CAF4336222.1 unnamed protein product [Rotaria sp. Silwood2]CAF4625934.1 unnamed protein product [Rotaria sp. Silwood2]
MQSTLRESSNEMVDEIFHSLSKDMHIVVCGSPRVGKSTLINAICGREVAEAREGLASVTQAIQCYTVEGQCNTESNTIHYKYNFWDTPGFESWDKHNIRPKLKEIIGKPDSKPVCMIFCASPVTFVDLTQLEWLLNLCINKEHIFCALVCTNKYAGQLKSRHAVLDTFKALLSKFVNEPSRVENDITLYGHIGLCASVNSEPYESENGVLPKSGINELIHGIMESLVDEQVLKWCFVVLENEGFWNEFNHKFATGSDAVKRNLKTIKKFFKRIKNRKVDKKNTGTTK